MGISRQRYWGCPIPIIMMKITTQLKFLRVCFLLKPEIKQFNSKGNPLEEMEEWKTISIDGKYKKETDTLDTFVDSSWYFLRFCSPKIDYGFNHEEANYWMLSINILVVWKCYSSFVIF